ncbi:MAG TPA: heavy metal translocating P-type ATPase [Thermoplasmata archaeon]|nr:heavy metal translocating P-type ATPase [Thermoplasmata archaeon]
MATDPVCGMFVDERTTGLKLVRGNRSYFFCSTHCLAEFAQPERALRGLRRKLAVAWPLSVAILLLTYAIRLPDGPWVILALATVVEFYPGFQFFVSTRDALKSRNWNMDILIAVGTTAAFGYSVAVLLLPNRLPPALYFDASALIVTLILTGNYLEHLTRERARGALRMLNELLPATASVLRDGREFELSISEVRPNDLCRVRPGGRFPTDGTVVEGRSTVNEALLTGESLPVEKGPGDTVIAGGVNGEGLLTLRATNVGEDTVLAQIGRLVTEAETSRVPLQQLADRIAATFVPVVLVLATAAALGWFAVGAGFTIALLVFVSVAITACPCAFGIATPAAIVVGTGRAAEEGILFKGKDSLERASTIDLVLTDKTGTLTLGLPTLTDLVPATGVTLDALLSVAAALEAGSEHPLARAVVEAASRRRLSVPTADGIRADPGKGIRGALSGTPLAVLNQSALREEGVELGPLRSGAERLTFEGKAWSAVLEAGRPIGLVGFSDELVPGARAAVSALTEDGISVAMATGDHETAARAVGAAVGISEVHAGMAPRDKLELIRELQRQGKKVAYVGDGINDAPALAAADLGIAIGAGSDVAREAGGVILLRSEFGDVARALRLGRRTVRKVRGNLAWAIGYNVVLLPVAMGALVPFLGLGVYAVLPITGALAMGISSTTVVLNSLSLRSVNRERTILRTPGRANLAH